MLFYGRDLNIWDSSWTLLPLWWFGTIHPHKKSITNGLPLPLSGRYHLAQRGWSYPSTTHPKLIVAELQCTGLYRAGYHPGCCLWGVGSGYTDTTKQQHTERTEKERRRERERRGGKTAPEEEYNTGKKGRGWMEGDGKRQWGKVQNGSCRYALLLLCLFPPVDNPPFLIPFPSMTHSFHSCTCLFINL